MREMTRYGVLRVLVAAYVAVWSAVRAPAVLDTLDFADRRFDPVGPLAFLDHPLPGPLLMAAVVVTPIAAAVLASGRREKLAGPTAAVGFLVVTTYRS